VEYDKIAQLAAQAQTLYTNNLIELDEAGSDPNNDDMFNMQAL
jgi:hypothetical protein